MIGLLGISLILFGLVAFVMNQMHDKCYVVKGEMERAKIFAIIIFVGFFLGFIGMISGL